MTEIKPSQIPQQIGGETETVNVLYVFTDDGSYQDGDPSSTEIATPVSASDLIALGLIASPPSL